VKPVALLLLLYPAIAFAAGAGAGHGEGHVNWKEIGFAALNFAVFLGGLVFLLRRPLREFLAHRRTTLEESLGEAGRARAEAEARLAELTARLANLDAERDRVLRQYQEEGEGEKQLLVDRARQNAELLRREVAFRIEQEARELRRELRRRAVDAAMTVAEQRLRAELDAQDRTRIADEYIRELRNAPPGAA
jgi:F-type H+-transporting ATPase subunit b